MKTTTIIRIGVDFDNTIICYDHVFHRVAREKGLIPETVQINKGAVRDYLREINDEASWTALQGYVYGLRLQEAAPFPGVKAFFLFCRKNHVPVAIISHKTKNPYAGPPYDLHRAAQAWLEANAFFDNEELGLPRDRVFFEQTKSEKIDRIKSFGCTHFIDDLPEFFTEPSFPKRVKKILFDYKGRTGADYPLFSVSSWDQLTRCMMEHLRFA